MSKIINLFFIQNINVDAKVLKIYTRDVPFHVPTVVSAILLHMLRPKTKNAQ